LIWALAKRQASLKKHYDTPSEDGEYEKPFMDTLEL
jgi:hypothetical protein